MMRVLAIDYGEQRIGLAISDELAITARPLITISRIPKAASFARIAEIIEQYEITKVVIGLPLRLDGTAGDAAAKVEKFASLLKMQISCPTVLWNEQLSSVEAEERMRSAGLNAAARKERIDQFAAMVILEDYLSCQRS